MSNALVAGGSVLTLVAVIPYLREIARGLTKPRLVTWTVWAGIDGVSAAGSFSANQLPAGIFTAVCSIECVLIVFLGFKRGERGFERLDFGCFAGALTGLVLLVVLKNPTYAVAVSITTDFVGTMPTLKHAWTRPHEETASTYALYTAGAALLLPVVDFQVFAAFAYPVYICVVDAGIVVILIVRSHAIDPVTNPMVTPSEIAGRPTRQETVAVTQDSRRMVAWSALGTHPLLRELANTSEFGDPTTVWVHKTRVLLASEVHAAVHLQTYSSSDHLNSMLTAMARDADHGSAQLGLMLGDSLMNLSQKASRDALHYASFLTSCAEHGLVDGLVALYARQLVQIELARKLESRVASGTWLHDWSTNRTCESFAVRADLLARQIDELAASPSLPQAHRLVWIGERVFRFELEAIDAHSLQD